MFINAQTLTSSTTKFKRVPVVYGFTEKDPATITVKVTSSGKPVIIDGIAPFRAP